ncbi:MAG: hypothetical protein ACRD2Q_10980 [Terriglobales bacterium]
MRWESHNPGCAITTTTPGCVAWRWLSTLPGADLDVVVRRIALIALIRSQTPTGAEVLREFQRAAPQDVMVREAEDVLRALGRTQPPQ